MHVIYNVCGQLHTYQIINFNFKKYSIQSWINIIHFSIREFSKKFLEIQYSIISDVIKKICFRFVSIFFHFTSNSTLLSIVTIGVNKLFACASPRYS